MENTYTLTIHLDGAAFGEDAEQEIARILRREADKLKNYEYHVGHSMTLLDVNGNDCGRAKIHPEN